MKLTILGCGTSTGVPVPTCTCDVCTSDNPKNKRRRTSALLETPGGECILIDASPDLREQSLTHGITRIDAVLFTHPHADHILGLDDLRCFCFSRTERIPCYGSHDTLTKIRGIFSYIFDHNPHYEGGMLAQLILHKLSLPSTLDIAGTTISALPVKHGKSDCTAFRLGSLAYITDCNFIPPETIELLRGVTTLVIGGLRYEPHPTHFTIPEAIAVFEELKATRAFITHTTHTIEYDEVSRQLPQGVSLAYDGLEVTVL